MKEPRQFTREEVERLIPEEDLQRRCISCMPREGRETPSNWVLYEAILNARLDLEQSRKDRDELLEWSRHDDSCASQRTFIDPKLDETIYPDCTCGLDALISRIEQSKKEQEHG